MLRTLLKLIPARFYTRPTYMLMILLLFITHAIIMISKDIIYDATVKLTWHDVNKIPPRDVGLVLGAKPGNEYFKARINAAASLYHAEKVKWLLVSGDNGRKDYDEPSAMQQALIAKGVPAAAIFCDYAGFSTLDSVVRAQKVFGADYITIISQEFHTRRAIWIAKQYGIDAIGFNAVAFNKEFTLYPRSRENLARVSAIIDASILHRQPKYSGPQVSIGPDSAHGCPAGK